MFKNGNARITRLVIFELGCGLLLMVIMQVQGNMVAQDWMSPPTLKKVGFILSTVGTLVKAMELFFSKTVALFQPHQEPEKQTTEKQIETKTS